MAVVDARGECSRRETRKDHGVNRSDARTSEHRNGQLGNHGQINTHAIALSHALLPKHIGKLIDPLVQVAIADVLRRLIGIVRLKEYGRLIGSIEQMPVETILRNVQLRPLKPLHLRLGKIPAQHLVPGLTPKKMLFRYFRPKKLRSLHRFAINLVILLQIFYLKCTHTWLVYVIGRFSLCLSANIVLPYKTQE